MTKGKAQRALEQMLFELSHSSSELSDPSYLQLGAELERGALFDGPSSCATRQVVGIRPVSARVPRLTFRATPIGMLAPTLLSTLAMEGAVIEAILAAARPRCRRCDRLAERSSSIDRSRIPSDGFLALVVDGIEEEISLPERCELLGIERVVVMNRLGRADEVDSEEGEPVLALIEAKRADELDREMELWFGRGGGALRVMHFADRGASGVPLQRVFQGWRCGGCATTFQSVSREAIEGAPLCNRCRGDGWLLVADERYVACEQCEGFGRSSPLAEYEVASTRLALAPLLTLEEVVSGCAFSAHDRELLAELIKAGLGGYRIGAPVGHLSKGERAAVTIASARASKLSDLTLLIDLGSLTSVADIVREGRQSEPAVLGFLPRLSYLTHDLKPMSMGEQLEAREISIGPLCGERVTFNRGEMTLLSGEQGSGKSLILREVYRRFQKRKKFLSTTSFGSIKSAEFIESFDGDAGVAADLMRVGSILAEAVASTRVARERGLMVDDLLTNRSKYLCVECSGTGQGEDMLCPVCEGALFEPLVGETPFRDTTVRELFQRPLSLSLQALSLHDAVESLRARLPKELLESLSLGTPLRSIAPGIRRFLSVYAPLCHLLADPKRVGSALILIDEPLGCAAEHQRLVVGALAELRGRGATVLCAGVARPLENIFTSVLRLVPYEVPGGDRVLARHYDGRMARRFRISRV